MFSIKPGIQSKLRICRDCNITMTMDQSWVHIREPDGVSYYLCHRCTTTHEMVAYDTTLPS